MIARFGRFRRSMRAAPCVEISGDPALDGTLKIDAAVKTVRPDA
jgi:hypothetical protein